MKELWNRILKDKILFVIFVAVCVTVLLDIALLVFDIVQFAIISNNRPALSAVFVPFNIVVVAVNILVAAAGICYAIFRKK